MVEQADSEYNTHGRMCWATHLWWTLVGALLLYLHLLLWKCSSQSSESQYI